MSHTNHEPRERSPRRSPKVTITRREYDVLLKKQEILDTLQANGVDEWPLYDRIMESFAE